MASRQPPATASLKQEDAKEDVGAIEQPISPIGGSNHFIDGENGNPESTESTPQPEQSVVSDLMRVYESMTQSKTPSIPSPFNVLPPASIPTNTRKHAPPSQRAGVESTTGPANIPIPPPYPLSTQQMQQQHPTSSSSLPTQTNGTNPQTRKRPAPAKLEEPQSTSTSSRRKSSKQNKSDSRWTKRFTWPDELHQDFVSAIFDVGLKHASPSTVLEHMEPHTDLTTERIKSHLQKYRLHRKKSKQDFMTCYGAALVQYRTEGMAGVKSLAGGGLAAHLTLSCNQPPADAAPEEQNGNIVVPSAKDVPKQVQQHQEVFVLPRLTEAEKASPVGTSLGYLLGLFYTLKQQLELQRQQEQTCTDVVDEAKPSAPVRSARLETSSMMKREMESQMAFQNKMRALKQHEIDKLSGVSTDTTKAVTAVEPVEVLGADARDRSMSIGGGTAPDDDEFWQTAASLDGDLFNFLLDS